MSVVPKAALVHTSLYETYIFFGMGTNLKFENNNIYFKDLDKEHVKNIKKISRQFLRSILNKSYS